MSFSVFRSLLSCLLFPLTLFAEPKVAVYDLNGPLSESGQEDPGMLGLNFEGRLPLTLFDLTQSLRAVVYDEDVKGVVLEVDQASLTLAQIESIHRHLLEVKNAGKEVWVYTDYFRNGTALLGSAATKFSLMPEAVVDFSGLFAESMYFKDMLDRIGVTADVVHIGDFKSFGEQFYRTGPSEFAQKQNDELLDEIFTLLIERIAEGREVQRGIVYQLINQGEVSAQNLLEKGLVDELVHRTDFVDGIYAHFGTEIEIDHEYHMRSFTGPKVEGMMDLMKLAFSGGKTSKPKKPYIALIPLTGAITDQSISPLRREILNLIEDEDELVQGIVLRIDSPGGSALASELLWEAIDEFKEVTELPVVASMGSVAASGGYYVASAADQIFAERSTITGSIGVVGMKLVIGGALEKLGISTHQDQRGQHAGIMNTTRPFTEKEKLIVQESMSGVYQTFLKRVQSGRGDRLIKPLEAIAGGRVYSGEMARKIGLVDQIGGLSEAIHEVRNQSGEETLHVHILPTPRSALDALFQNTDESERDVIDIQSSPPSPTRLKLQETLLSKGALPFFTWSQQRQLQLFLNQLSSFQQQRIQLMAPPLPFLSR